MPLGVLLIWISLTSLPLTCVSSSCPILECRCTSSKDILCTDKHLKHVPTLKHRGHTAKQGQQGPVVTFNVFDLTGNDIVQIPAYAFRGLRLRSIHIENNPLIGLSPNAFSWNNCVLLKSLSIIDTPIRVIHWSMFRKLKQLEVLDLSSNLMRFIPNGVFCNLINLKILSLASNNIRQWKASVLRTLPKLKRLDLSNNQISSIQRNSFVGPQSLTWLNFANNRLTILNKTTFAGLHRLESLLLANNQITLLQRAVLEQLPVLKHLELSNNNITQLTKRMFMAINKVQSISIRNNFISKIAIDAFQSLKEFTLLRLDDNRITHFGDTELDGQLSSVDTCPPKGLISLVQLSLIGNPLNCSCRMYWARRISRTRLDNSKTSSISEPRTPTSVSGHCSYPLRMSGSEIDKAPFIGCTATKCKSRQDNPPRPNFND